MPVPLGRHGFERQSAFGIRPMDDGGPFLHIVAAWTRAPLTDAGTVYSPEAGYVQAADGASVWGSGLVRISVATGSLVLMPQGLYPACSHPPPITSPASPMAPLDRPQDHR